MKAITTLKAIIIIEVTAVTEEEVDEVATAMMVAEAAAEVEEAEVVEAMVVVDTARIVTMIEVVVAVDGEVAINLGVVKCKAVVKPAGGQAQIVCKSNTLLTTTEAMEDVEEAISVETMAARAHLHQIAATTVVAAVGAAVITTSVSKASK